MFGLHNILFIASSQQQTPNPHTISSDHHHHHNDNNHPTNLSNQDCNFNGSTNPWSLKKCQELSIVGDESRGSFGTCTDCGNKAKKECKYRRCRTCCKSRGYDCSTHVKSTWVPASRRRERHQLGGGGGGGGGGGSSGSSSGCLKRPRIVSSGATTSNSLSSNADAAAAAASLCFDTGSSPQDPCFKQSLPGKVEAPAVFRCIRVTAISGEEAEVLYQATVNICGHVFKGFLYNQGIDEKKVYPCISNVHMESSTDGREFSVPIVKPSNAYAASGNRRLFEATGNE